MQWACKGHLPNALLRGGSKKKGYLRHLGKAWGVLVGSLGGPPLKPPSLKNCTTRAPNTPHKQKDPTKHGFWYPPCIGSWNQNARSLILYYTTIYFTILQYILYYDIPYHTIPYHTIPYHTIRYDAIRYDTIRYDTVPYQTRLD